MAERKFDKLFENVVARYQRGDFLTGDLVQFTKNALKSEWANKLSPIKRQKLQEMIDSGDNLRVSTVKSAYPMGGHGDWSQQTDQIWVTIVQERAPGLYMNFIDVPQELLEQIDVYPNLPPVGDNKYRKDNSYLKPKNVEKSDKGNARKATHTDEGDKELKNKNTKLPNGQKWEDGTPGNVGQKYYPKKGKKK